MVNSKVAISFETTSTLQFSMSSHSIITLILKLNDTIYNYDNAVIFFCPIPFQSLLLAAFPAV